MIGRNKILSQSYIFVYFDFYYSMHEPPSNIVGPTICTGCSLPIDEQFLLCVMGTCWHERCLVCVGCQEPLVTTCYHKEGKFYCKRDYFE